MHWSHATAVAENSLRHHDVQLNRRASSTKDREQYQLELVSLAINRFDTWAERGLAVVNSQTLYTEYAAWLHTYATNWLAYVTETCPHVSINEELNTRLTIRTDHWSTIAQARLRPSAS